MQIGRLRVHIKWIPLTITKLWKGGKWSISFMWETNKLHAMRDKIRATAKRRLDKYCPACPECDEPMPGYYDCTELFYPCKSCNRFIRVRDRIGVVHND